MIRFWSIRLRPAFVCRIALVVTLVPVFLSGCSSSHISVALSTRDHGAPIRGDRLKKRMALIFTGGEHGEGTAFILDALQASRAKGSFFVTGDYLANAQYRGLVGRMIAEGHYVGPHSDSHPLYCDWEHRSHTLVTEGFFRSDLQRNIADLRRLGALQPGEPVYFIPPYEWFNADQVRWAHTMGVILFNFTPGIGSNRDWAPESHPRFTPSKTILRDTLAYERREPHGLGGALLLLHLGSQRADKMHFHVPTLLAELRSRDYTFVRVDELLTLSPEPVAMGPDALRRIPHAQQQQQ